MKVQKGMGGIYPVAILSVMVMLHINAYYCAGAAVVVKSNTTTVRYNNGRGEESLIEYDLALELLMNPYTTRMLTDPKAGSIYKTGDKDRPACQPPSPCSGGGNCPSTYLRTCNKKKSPSPS